MRRHLALFSLFGSIAGGLTAQTGTPSWGTTAESVLWIGAFQFEPRDGSAPVATGNGSSRWITSGTVGEWSSSVSLPSGALVTGLELMGCDLTSTGSLVAAFGQQTITLGVEDSIPLGMSLITGIAATPGCGQFAVTFPSPVTIDNSSSGYLAFVIQDNNTSGDVRFQGVRVRYKLQVSPAPGAATFADVPVGHQQFRFVEALFAAGITAGCGGGNFCPDQPVTRGQMAVFLSAALGLHFPN